MQRIAAMAAELSYGQFPVRLTTTTLNGYGYASPLCYCELFLLLPALLYNLWLPLRTCYQVYLFAVTLATCLIAYFSFAKITASRRLGLLGALLYTLSAYRLTCVYTRAAVGEFTAMAFFPLVRHLHQRQAPLRGLAADGAGHGGHGAEPSALL